jgi:hypothetical protein
MVTAVDTSVLFEVMLNDTQPADHSIASHRQAANEGSLVIGEVASYLPLNSTFRSRFTGHCLTGAALFLPR